ncbi:4Fe-4S binding protein [Chlorobium sp. N1]|uniref:4Fe-4S dicluster domain-containing protein n=1 Tax=Chlorobium sp. N1 TaxID=2491138 RepID=UPI00103F2788|nr:4Fe-4S binding protein [Chlorobium sp. N1]TCD48019.1 ferredoxin family protein [Chlorobium sp. N1]
MSTPRQKKRLTAPREEIAWFPVIDAELCNGCGECESLCRPGVFAPAPAAGAGRPKMTVANPFNCVVLCTRCVPRCPSGAITLPEAADFEHFVELVN